MSERGGVKHLIPFEELERYFNGVLAAQMGVKGHDPGGIMGAFSAESMAGPNGSQLSAALTQTEIRERLSLVSEKHRAVLRACYTAPSAPVASAFRDLKLAAGWAAKLAAQGEQHRKELCKRRQKHKRGSEAFKTAQKAVADFDASVCRRAREDALAAQQAYKDAKRSLAGLHGQRRAHRQRTPKAGPKLSDRQIDKAWRELLDDDAA